MYRLTPEHTKDRMKLLLYGPQGSGKTFLAATAQDHVAMGPVLFLNVEGGLMSIASRGDIDVEDIADTKALETVFWKLQQKSGEFAKYRTVVIDSVTELQNKNLVEIAAEGGTRENKGPDDLSQRDYGKSTVQLRRILRWYRDLPLNLIMTALPKRVYEKTIAKGVEPAAIEVRPSLTDKLCDSVMGYVDFVWYYWLETAEDGTKKRRLLTCDRGLYKAKTRGVHFADAIGLVVDNPTLPGLYDAYCAAEVIPTSASTKGGKK